MDRMCMCFGGLFSSTVFLFPFSSSTCHSVGLHVDYGPVNWSKFQSWLAPALSLPHHLWDSCRFLLVRVWTTGIKEYIWYAFKGLGTLIPIPESWEEGTGSNIARKKKAYCCESGFNKLTTCSWNPHLQDIWAYEFRHDSYRLSANLAVWQHSYKECDLRNREDTSWISWQSMLINILTAAVPAQQAVS